MSIREELLRNLRGYTPCGVDDETDAAAQMLNAFEAQVLHKAAEKLRDASPFGRGPCALGQAADYRCNSEYCESCAIKNLIDLIDPQSPPPAT